VPPVPPLVLFAAALLRIPARRIRALGAGDGGALRDWLANESVERLAEARRDARVALGRLEALGGRVVALEDPEYPAGLRELRDPPAGLTVRGTLPARSRWREGTAIVGTRTPDATARAVARALAAALPGPIVSGLALGIDAAAHEGSLAAGTPTLAYVGNGLATTYPPEHADLAERIVAGGGALLSEALPDEPVTKWSLVRRDRLQAAHAVAVVLVQSEAGGGAMHAIEAARRLGRARFAFEPSAPETYGGNERALADGARCLPWNARQAAAAIANLAADR
jgi:DNA processing protein